MFASRLYSKDLEIRYTWIKNQCDRYLSDHSDRKDEIYSLLNELKGL